MVAYMQRNIFLTAYQAVTIPEHLQYKPFIVLLYIELSNRSVFSKGETTCPHTLIKNSLHIKFNLYKTMQKFYLFILFPCIFISINTHSQSRINQKLGGLSLYKTVQKPEYAHSPKLKNILVKGEPGSIKDLTAKYRGVYKYAAGEISSIAIPYKNLIAFSKEPAVINIEGTGVKGFTFMDTARIRNNIDSAQNGISPLLQAYKGTGVIVGIIDGGIYFRHQDFRRANGNTRILYLWDQSLSTAPSPQPYGYGAEWDTTAINAGLCTSSDPSGDQGHGTNVAGIAAGNGSSFTTGPLAGRYTGTAPDADMIVVNLVPSTDVADTNLDFLQNVVDAADYIYAKATALGRPCVINLSQGTYFGSHDGLDLPAQAVDAMITAQHGRVFVAASGNSGGYRYHLSYPLSATDSLFTWFAYNASYQQVYYDMWADTTQFRQGTFAIGCDNSTPSFLARTRYFNAATDFSPVQGATVQITDTLFQGLTNLGIYTIAVTLSGSVYHIEFYILPTVTSYLWRLQTLGQGTFDLWDYNSAIPGTSNPLPTPGTNTPLPGGFSSPNYMFPDSFKTIVSSWQCSDKVITVGNYSNRTAYQDSAGAFVPSNLIDGSLVSNSSIGPTRDGRIKPDITATGTVTTATGDSLYIALLSGSGQGSKVSLGGKHTRNGGTSMASPIVAGVAALYLQEHPNADYSEVKTVLERTALVDNFTTGVPNVAWGYGKVNCYQALLYPVVYGCTDTGSVNYNAAATIDTGGCTAKIYGCTDTGSINYNAAANVNNGACILKVYGITDTACTNYNPLANVSGGVCVPLGITDLSSNISFDVIPNPFSNTTTIKINTTTPLVNASVKFYDMLGNQVDVVNVPTGTNEVVYTNTKMASGMYTATVISSGKVVAVKKVIAE
jgi:hypothetical protein